MRRFWLGIVAILLIISGFIVLNSFEKKQQPILPSQGVVTYAGNVPFVEREVIPVPGYQADSLPIKEESILNNFTKRVVVSSSAEFKDINISTLVPHVSKHSIRVRYVNNSASENVGIINVEEINATVDKITWKGTSANYQVFDVGYGNYFEIIDKTSDLVAGDNWTVQFKTYAAYNLTITPIGGNFSEMKNDNLATSDDLKYLSLKCKDLYGNYVDRTNDVIVVGFDGSKRSYSTLTGQSYRAKSLFLEHNWWFSNNVNDCKLTTNILKTDAALQFNYVYLGFQSELYTIIENASSSPAVVTDCTMITEPGYYQLKSDFAENTYYINNVGNPACIHIFDTDDVSLNCRGHNISMGFYSFPGILVESNSGPFPDNITIKNCNLKYIDLYFFVNSGELINNTARSNILVWGHSYYPFPNNNINAINNRVIGGEFSLGSVGGSNFINNSVTRFYLVNSNNNNLTGNTVVGIATPGSDYFESAGIELENSNNNSFSSNDVSNSTVGFLLYYFSANNTLNNNSAHDNLVDGFSLYADSYPIYYEINNTLTNNIAYDNQGNGLRVVGHNNTIINTTLYGNAKQTSIWMPAVYNHVAYVTPYQMRVEGSELYGNHFFNTTIYTNKTGFETDRYLFQDIYSEYTTEHLPNYYSKLNLCYNESYGCVSWDNLSPEHNFNLTLTNLLLNPNFVSLDDTEYSWLNSSANITLLTNVSCFRTGYFKKSGFPQSWSDIVNNGNVINTTYSVCNEGTRIATFGVDSFSGYAPSEVLSNASNITGCINIDSPGGYQLANDLVGARNYGTFPFFNKIACIYINASNVALDCAGYNMTNNDTLFASAVLVSSGVNNIEIKNCLVINYSYGVNTGSDNTTIISNYAYSYDYGFSVNGDNNNLSDNTAYNSGYGFWFNGNNGDISNNIVYNYTSYGFYVLGAYTLLNNNLALDFRNDTNGFSAVGISAGGRNFTITNNNVTGLFGSGYGFYLDMINVSLIANNTAFGNAYSGFFIVGSTNNLFDNNSASRNGNYLDITGNYYIEAGFLLGVSPSGYSFNNLFTNNIAYENEKKMKAQKKEDEK